MFGEFQAPNENYWFVPATDTTEDVALNFYKQNWLWWADLDWLPETHSVMLSCPLLKRTGGKIKLRCSQVEMITHQLLSQNKHTQLFHLLLSPSATEGTGNRCWSQSVIALLSYSFLLTYSPALVWGPSHVIQSLKDLSNVGPFHQVHSFRNRLFHHGSHMRYSSWRKHTPVQAPLHIYSSRSLFCHMLPMDTSSLRAHSQAAAVEMCSTMVFRRS